MRVRARLLSALLLSVTATILSAQPPLLGPAERIADGVVLYRLGDPGLLDPPGPVAVQALRLDPRKVTLEMGLAEDRVPAREAVQAIAARREAIAAVNAGSFSLFVEMQGLARRLGLRSALNLDGGGSTTMVAGGTIVNHPSDAAGPRKVSDALLVVPRKD